MDANAVFVIVPEHIIEPLRAVYPFYEWDAATHEQRWMCSFDTTEAEVEDFTNKLKELLYISSICSSHNTSRALIFTTG